MILIKHFIFLFQVVTVVLFSRLVRIFVYRYTG